MLERKIERCVYMSEEEAMALLDLALLCPGDLTLEQRSAIVKLSEFCRQFLREEIAESGAGRTTGSRPPMICAV